MLWLTRVLLLLMLAPLLPSALAAGYPRTLVTGLGSAEIKAPPQRVVALGSGAEDILLQFGVVPVGVEGHYWGGDKQGFLPWFRAELARQHAPLPAVLNFYPEPDIEAILRLQPDLVVATQSGMTQEVFDQLSWFVPVVAWPKRPWLTTPVEQIRLIGKALNRDPQPLLDDLDNSLKQAALAIPDIHQYSFAYIRGGASGGALSAYVSGDPRVDTLSEMGLKLIPALADIQPQMGSFSTFIGLENADQMNDADIVISWYFNQRDRQSIESQPLFRSIRAYQQGSYIPLMDPALSMAMGFGTPLSMRWGIKQFIPLLQEAVAHVKR